MRHLLIKAGEILFLTGDTNQSGGNAFRDRTNAIGVAGVVAVIMLFEDVIKRMDKRWDHGFITSEQEYIENRLRLQLELEQLTPVPDDELEQALDLLENFQTHWKRLEGDEEGRHELVKLIVERGYVEDDRVVAMTLHFNYHMVLGHKINEPTEFTVDPFLYRSGSDGIRSLTCIKFVIIFIPKHIVKQYLVTVDPSHINGQSDKSHHPSI
jgi:hypothetical protein